MKFNDLMFEWEPSPEDRPEVPCLASLSEAACRSPSFPPRASPARPRLLHPPPRPKFSRFGGQFVPRNSRPLSGLGSRVTHTLAGLRAALVMALVQASQQSKSASGQLARQLTAAWQQHAGAASRRVLSRGGRLWQQRRPRGLEPGIASPAVGPRARGPTSATPEVERLVQAGLAAERQYNVQLAVECFEEALRLEPDSLALHCLAAKQWTDLSLALAAEDGEARRAANSRSAELTAAALAMAPGCAHAHVLGSIAAGRLAALAPGARQKVGLAAAAQAAAGAALAADPDNDHAHHLLGRWHYEMARVNPTLRALGRMAYGSALVAGSREAALEAYLRAAALRPGRLIHRVECGRVLLDLGRREEAQGHLRAALACEAEDLNAWHSLKDARRMLAQLDGAAPAPEGGLALGAGPAAVPVQA
ncbi:hypothetical protein ACKKBG_A22925 [Auxenochlorella protothecoides x Auxenochlorella symbiontica]